MSKSYSTVNSDSNTNTDITSNNSNNSNNSISKKDIQSYETPIISTDLERNIYEKISNIVPIQSFNSDCVRKKSNWSNTIKNALFDEIDYDPSIILENMHYMSPKLEKLLDVIKQLDDYDVKKDGHTYKHFIFTDLKSGSHGAKLIASALISKGMTCGYFANPKTQNKKTDKKFSKIELLDNDTLIKSKGNNFYLLLSGTIFDQSLSIAMKKTVLKNFNSRPDNVYGDYSRIIIMDSGFKEGIDLFDIKYIHIFEPQSSLADQKQVIGRGTRTCGQKGLLFHPTSGWPLYVFNYDIKFNDNLPISFSNKNTGIDLYLYSLGINLRLINFTSELEEISMIGSVDYELNKNIHDFKIEDNAKNEYNFIKGGSENIIENSNKFLAIKDINYDSIKEFVKKNLNDYSWQNVKMENMCGYNGPENQVGGSTIMNYTPTQAFVKNYFTPENPIKGMLLYHSVGTGKTCSAIAASSSTFERQGYTILWVTRTTLKNDIWKNMFDQVCSDTIKEKINLGIEIPDVNSKRMRMLNKSWSIRPMSYKQFSNMILGQNSFYKALIKKNGKEDPLYKTLIIIDEAHKLYGGADLSSIEKPDMDAFTKAIYNSHIVSGENSAKVLLMTATPITNDPMELIKLINLCKRIDDKIPDNFEVFSEKYLNETGRFTDVGKKLFLDHIAGYISFLNREKDARQFSQPYIRNIQVPILDKNTYNFVQNFSKRTINDEYKYKLNKLNQEISNNLKEINSDINDLDKNRFKHMTDLCVNYEGNSKTCNKIVNSHIKELINEAKEYINNVRAEIKEIKIKINDLKISKKLITDNIKNYNEDMYNKFKSSTFYGLINECRKDIRTVKELEEQMINDPVIIDLNKQRDVIDSNIIELENVEKIRIDGIKKYIRRLNKFLKTYDLNDNEEMLITKMIEESKNKIKNEKEEFNSMIKIEKNKALSKKSKLRKMKKKYTRKLIKSFKNQNKILINEDKNLKKTERNMLKELRKTENINEEFKNKVIKDLVEKHINAINNDIQQSIISDQDKHAEKAKLKADKEDAKAKLKADKEDAKLYRKTLKNNKNSKLSNKTIKNK